MKSPLSAVAALALLAPVGRSADYAKILLEAESSANIRPPFQKVFTHSGKASGGAYLLLPWDQNKAKSVGSVAYRFNVQKPGVYYLWTRTYWTPDQGNSVAATINGDETKILGEDGTYSQWHWVGGKARVALKVGENILVLHNRETGVRIDQFLLTQEPPTASGPNRKISG